jgi:hypothetical protein
VEGETAKLSSFMGARLPVAGRVEAGETITLLCSPACTDAERCHRSLLLALLSGAVQ